MLSFEFKADALGEIHAIGLDADNNHENSDEFLFALAGSQNLSELNNEYKNYSGNSWQSYSIPVGEYFTGSMNYVALVGDDDAAQAQQSSFRNIQLVESDNAVTVKVRVKMLAGGSDKLELRIDGQKVKDWTVSGSSYQFYSTTISQQQAESSNIRLYFADQDTDVQVDYLELDEVRYETEDQQVNTATLPMSNTGKLTP